LLLDLEKRKTLAIVKITGTKVYLVKYDCYEPHIQSRKVV